MNPLFRRTSIRVQLLLLALAVALPVVAILAYYIADEAQQARHTAYARLEIVAGGTAARLDRILREHQSVLVRLAARPRVRALDPRDCDPIIGEYVSLHPEFTTLAVRDAQGRAICSFNPNPPAQAQVAGLAWFQDGLRSGALNVSNAYLGQTSGRWLSVLTYPIRNGQGEVTGLIALALDLAKLNERVFQQMSGNAGQMVLDRDGIFLLRSADPAAWIGKSLPSPQAESVRANSADLFSLRDVNGVQRLHAVAAVPGTGWRVFAGQPEDEVYADYRGRLVRAIVVGFAVLLLVSALAWRIGSAIAGPVLELARTATEIAGGDLAARARLAGPAEIEHVARQFNHMLDALARQREERAALVRHMERLFQLARDVILLIDPEGRVVEANDAAVAAYGYSADELRGMNIRTLRSAETQAGVERDWQASAGPEGVRFESVHRRKDGSEFPVEVSARTIDIDSKLYRQSFIRDISERRAAEIQIRRLNRAYATLSETNQAIVRLSDAQELFTNVCRIAVDFGGYVGAWVGLVDAQTGGVAAAAIDGKVADYVRQIRVGADPAQPEGQGPVACALREGRPYYCQDFLNDPATEHWRDLAPAFGIRSVAALPLRRGGAVIGTFNLYSAEAEVFDAPTQSLLEEMATDISFALDNFDRETARRESEERFRSMLEQNISAVFMIENGVLTYANRRAGEVLGYPTEELMGKPVLDLIVEADRPSIVEAARLLLSGESKTVEQDFRVLRKDGTVGDIGGHATVATLNGKKAVLGIARDIGERKKSQAEIGRYIVRLEQAMEATLQAVSGMVELRDPYTAGHEHRVGELAAAIGAEMGLPDATVKGLRLAGYVHDIGKISVPAEILSKPSRLTPMEFELIKGHSQSGYDVLKNVDFPWPVAEIILQHHERLDGSGYPRQLKDGEIIMEARIIAVADVVEAMSSHRPYRPGLGIDAALDEIARNSGRIYDARVAAACLRLFRERGYALSA